MIDIIPFGEVDISKQEDSPDIPISTEEEEEDTVFLFLTEQSSPSLDKVMEMQIENSINNISIFYKNVKALEQALNTEYLSKVVKVFLVGLEEEISNKIIVNYGELDIVCIDGTSEEDMEYLLESMKERTK